MNIYISVFTLAVVLTLVTYLWLSIVGFKRSVLWGILILLLSPLTAIIFAFTNWFDARKAFLSYIVAFVLMCGSAIVIYSDVGMGNMHQIATRMSTGKLGPGQAYQLITRALAHTGPVDLFAEEVQAVTADATATKPNPAEVPPTALPVPATELELAQAEAAGDTDKPAAAHKSESKPGDAAGAQTRTENKAEATPTPTAAPKQSDDNTGDNSAETKPEKPRYPTPDQVQADPLAQKHKKEEPNTIVVRLDKMANYTGHYFIITLKSGNQQRGLLRKVDDKKLILVRKLYGGNIEYRIRKDQIKSIEMLKHVPEER